MAERHTLLTVVAGTVIGTRPYECLAGSHVTLIVRQNLALQGVNDLFGADPAALERGVDRESAKGSRAESLDRAEKVPHRRMSRSDDH